uniref:UTP:GlnB (Protein PII) uridylyltransferase n=1 Tax=Magnetospirillum gryphiswaldense TaxID=55518 RepID=A4TTQ5_9PROT|nr:UTP:GlnB (protein PII) uridylyltransferase [Magnetospirillum gryphiswaldense MSR-1]
MARLTELAGSDINKMKRRAGVLAVFKEALNLGRFEVPRRFDQHGDGTQTVPENCFLIDQLVRIVHDFAGGH